VISKTHRIYLIIIKLKRINIICPQCLFPLPIQLTNVRAKIIFKNVPLCISLYCGIVESKSTYINNWYISLLQLPLMTSTPSLSNIAGQYSLSNGAKSSSDTIRKLWRHTIAFTMVSAVRICGVQHRSFLRMRYLDDMIPNAFSMVPLARLSLLIKYLFCIAKISVNSGIWTHDMDVKWKYFITKVKEKMTSLPRIFFGRGKSISLASIVWPKGLFAHFHHFEIL